MGGAPFENPRVVVTMIIHEPDKALAHYGGTVAAPGASHLLERALSYLQVQASPDLPVPPAAGRRGAARLQREALQDPRDGVGAGVSDADCWRPQRRNPL